MSGEEEEREKEEKKTAHENRLLVAPWTGGTCRIRLACPGVDESAACQKRMSASTRRACCSSLGNSERTRPRPDEEARDEGTTWEEADAGEAEEERTAWCRPQMHSAGIDSAAAAGAPWLLASVSPPSGSVVCGASAAAAVCGSVLVAAGRVCGFATKPSGARLADERRRVASHDRRTNIAWCRQSRKSNSVVDSAASFFGPLSFGRSFSFCFLFSFSSWSILSSSRRWLVGSTTRRSMSQINR